MRIYIDCGSNFGGGPVMYTQEYALNATWKCFGFEPNSAAVKRLTKMESLRHFAWIEAAAWIRNGTIDFYMCEKDSGGSSLYQGVALRHAAWAIRYHKLRQSPDSLVRKVEINCIDLAEFILKNVSTDDYCVMKLDVEGAEYSIIKWLWYRNVLPLIKRLHIEWHQMPLESKYSMLQILNQYDIEVFEHD